MIPIVNLSPLGFAARELLDPGGAPVHVLCVTASFSIPAPGGREPPTLREEQPPPPITDEHHGEPGSSGLVRAGQLIYPRDGSDVYVRGHTWAPGGRPRASWSASLRVGPVGMALRVSGDRRWERGVLGGLYAGEPRPLVRVPLIHERAVGGPVEPRNPVGVGVHARGGDAVGEPLPNLEDPRSLLRCPGERPAPRCPAPIACHWSPRSELAGTYDRAWIEERAPFWPADLDRRFFHLAHPDLRWSERLRGGEEVELTGLHPDGALRFRLPGLALQLKIRAPGATRRLPLAISGVEIDVDDLRLTLHHHGLVDARPGAVREASVRLREAWEDVPFP